MRTITGKLEIIRRLPSSYYGNPRYLCSIAGTEFRTRPDSSFGYCITNYEGQRVKVQVKDFYNNLSLYNIKGA